MEKCNIRNAIFVLGCIIFYSSRVHSHQLKIITHSLANPKHSSLMCEFSCTFAGHSFSFNLICTKKQPQTDLLGVEMEETLAQTITSTGSVDAGETVSRTYG